MIKAAQGRIVIEVPKDLKNWHTFASGLKIRLERSYDNFNLRYTTPVNGFVLASDILPQGTQILVQYNAIQDTFKVHNYKPLSGQEIASEIEYYSIPEEMAYAYLLDGEWKPLKGYAFGLRVFRPYNGILAGIEPAKIKDTLYVTTGELKGKVVRTLIASDYQIVYQDINGKEGNIICFQHFEDDENNQKENVLCIMDELTDQVHDGQLLIGLDKNNSKLVYEYN